MKKILPDYSYKYSGQWLACIFVTSFALVNSAQEPAVQPSDVELLASWVALDAPTGHEHLATRPIQEKFAEWERDDYGNLSKLIGSGTPHRVVACGLDSYAYAVSQITGDGYLRLHRIARGSRHPLWDQAHEGQQLRILTRSGPLIGVSAIANGHFASQHRGDTAIVTQDDLWLDVGASSAQEVGNMGIQLLDPVVRNLPPWSYGDQIAGPRAGARVSCAAVLAAAEAGINGPQGSTRYVLSVQQNFGWIGLGAAISRGIVPVRIPDKLIIVAAGEIEFRQQQISEIGARVDSVISEQTRASLHIISPRVQDRDALMERVDMSAANQLLAALTAMIDPNATMPVWLAAPQRAVEINHQPARWGRHQDTGRMMEVERLLDQLAEQSAVPGHEGPIRNIVYNALPAWAREVAQADEMGNMWVEFGPQSSDSDATVFIAHMDEVGWEVESIEANGVVNLTRLGGVVTTAWEGQPALLQLDANTDVDSLPSAPQLRGVFLVRDRFSQNEGAQENESQNTVEQKRPARVRAWFGMNAEQLVAAGVQVGMGITGYKEGHRMGEYRYAARSLDDRVGTAALLMALSRIDRSRLANPVVFAWSVREEGGLRGATRLAEYYGQKARRVYSIDTFVSSDTPLESPHFAYAPLGDGPVLRSIESAGMATPYELDRNKRVAFDAGIEVQVGLTQGSTDGTGFTPYGAPNGGLSWPGRYSHSPAEIADLRDVVKLIDLIQAMAEAPSAAN